MDKLTEFYLSLATDATMMQRFNQGESQEQLQANRLAMLQEHGVEDATRLASMTQIQLKQALAIQLSHQSSEWRDVDNLARALDNNDNRVSSIGRSSF